MKKKVLFKAKTMDNLFVYLVLLWPVIHFCIFTIGMNVSMFVASFRDVSGAWVGFEKYASVFNTFTGRAPTDVYARPSAILNSFSILPLSLFINMPISLFFAYALYKKYFASKFYSVVLFIPTVVSAVVLCLVYKMALSSDFGFVSSIIKDMGGTIPDLGLLGDESTAWNSILIFSVWTGISTNMIYFSSALGRVSESVIESAKIDGAGEIRQFFVMVVPMIWGTLTTVSITAVSGMFGWYLPALLLTNGSANTTTMGLVVVANANNQTIYNFISAFGVIIAVVGTAVTYGVKWLMERFWRDVEY